MEYYRCFTWTGRYCAKPFTDCENIKGETLESYKRNMKKGNLRHICQGEMQNYHRMLFVIFVLCNRFKCKYFLVFVPPAKGIKYRRYSCSSILTLWLPFLPTFFLQQGFQVRQKAISFQLQITFIMSKGRKILSSSLVPGGTTLRTSWSAF